nr:unnamed protein product [Callosobruchus analis]
MKSITNKIYSYQHCDYESVTSTNLNSHLKEHELLLKDVLNINGNLSLVVNSTLKYECAVSCVLNIGLSYTAKTYESMVLLTLIGIYSTHHILKFNRVCKLNIMNKLPAGSKPA